MVDILLTYKASTSLVTEEEETPLHYVAKSGCVSIGKALLNAGASLESLDVKDQTPLHLASIHQHSGCVKLFLERGACADPLDTHNKMPKELTKDKKIVDLLTKAEVEQKEKRAREKIDLIGKLSPLCSAASSGDLAEVIKILDNKTDLVDNPTGDGSTALHYASLKGHDKVVDELLKRGASFLVKDSHGDSPQHLAALRGKTDCITCFYKYRASLDLQNDLGMTPLHYAASKGHLETVVKLLECEASPHIKDFLEFEPLKDAVIFGRTAVVKVLLPLLKTSLDKKDKKGKALLHYAAEKGYTDIVTLLLTAGASGALEDDLGQTPLFLACKKGHEGAAKLLVRHGLNDPSKTKDTPLHCAAGGGYTDIVCLLLENEAHMGLSNNRQHTPLYVAASRGYVGCVQELLEHEAPLNTQDKRAWQPIHIAACAGHCTIVQLLLDKGASFTSRTSEKWTPLHCAAAGNAHKVVSELLKHSDVSKLFVQSKDSPFVCALEFGDNELIDQFFKWASDATCSDTQDTSVLYRAAIKGDEKAILGPTKKTNQKRTSPSGNAYYTTPKKELDKPPQKLSLSTCDIYGLTPLHWACYYDQTEVVMAILKKDTSLIDSQDAFGFTPLHYACMRGHLSSVTLLLRYDAKKLCDKFGRTPLHRAACNNGSRMIVDMLLGEYGYLLNMKDNSGKTALMWAVLSGQVECVQVLLDQKADKSIQDKKGRTALAVANMMKCNDIIELLNK